MREEIGGVKYDAGGKIEIWFARNRADFSAAKDTSPRAELLLRLKTKAGEVPTTKTTNWPDLEESQRKRGCSHCVCGIG